MDELEQMNDDFVQTRSAVFVGTIGAFIGALLGGALWVLINQAGIMASIAGYAIIFCACKGYAALAKELDVKGVIIAMVVSIIVLTAAHCLCWGIDIYKEFSIMYDINLMDAILAMPSIIKDARLVGLFFRDYAIGFAVAILGGIPYLYSAMSSKKIEDEMM